MRLDLLDAREQHPILNLRGLFEALRQQLDDNEDLRLIESAARA